MTTEATASAGEARRREVRHALPVLTLARLITNGALRFTPPFLVPVARSLGVEIGTVGLAVSASEIAGLSAPVVGRRIDRSSRRAAMVMGLLAVAVCCIVGATAAGIPMYLAFLLGVSFTKIVYDASMGAWVADRVPYGERGRVVGIMETAWAGSYLVVIPLLALLAQVTSWRWALGGLGVASALFAVAVGRRLAADPPHPSADGHGQHLVGLARTVPVFAAVGCMMAGAQSVVIVFGAWLEDQHGFSTAAIGGVAFLLGVGELIASTSTIRFTDRLGKRRAVLLGLGIMAPAALGLALTSDHAALGIPLLMLVTIGFEFALVSALPLVAELHPEARATSIGIGFGFGTVGRGAGAAVSTWLYSRHGMGTSALIGSVMAGVSALLVAIGGRRAEAHLTA